MRKGWVTIGIREETKELFKRHRRNMTYNAFLYNILRDIPDPEQLEDNLLDQLDFEDVV